MGRRRRIPRSIRLVKCVRYDAHTFSRVRCKTIDTGHKYSQTTSCHLLLLTLAGWHTKTIARHWIRHSRHPHSRQDTKRDKHVWTCYARRLRRHESYAARDPQTNVVLLRSTARRLSVDWIRLSNSRLVCAWAFHLRKVKKDQEMR